jgi:hypothetical protein
LAAISLEKELRFEERQIALEVLSANRRSDVVVAQITAYLPMLGGKVMDLIKVLSKAL